MSKAELKRLASRFQRRRRVVAKDEPATPIAQSEPVSDQAQRSVTTVIGVHPWPHRIVGEE